MSQEMTRKISLVLKVDFYFKIIFFFVDFDFPYRNEGKGMKKMCRILLYYLD